MQAIYVPADDYTDPAPATTFAHLDATTELARDIASMGIYPAVDPLTSTSRILDPRFISRGALRRGAARSSRSCSATRSCRTSSPSSASTSCPRRTSSSSAARGGCSGSSSQNTYVAKQFTGIDGSTVPLEDTIEAFTKICDGEYDHVAEQAFFMCGGLDDVERKWAEIQKEG